MRTVNDASLERRLQWWREAGLISEEQVTRILAAEAAWAEVPEVEPAVPPGRGAWPTVAEALGYIGAIFALTGGVLLVSKYWVDMGPWARVALGAAVALVLLVAGLFVHEETPSLQRLQASLWLLSTVAAGFTTAVFMVDGLDVDRGESVTLAVAAVVALQNGVLWGRHVRPVQQGLFLTSLPVMAGAAMLHLTEIGTAGFMIALTGIVLLWLGMTGRTVLPALTDAVGGAALVVGAFCTIDLWENGGFLAAVAVGSVLAGISLSPHVLRSGGERVVLAVAGLAALFQSVPMTLGRFSDEAAVVTGLVVAAIGVALMMLGHRGVSLAPAALVLVGGVAVVGGLALTGRQSVGLATIGGLVVALGLLTLGARRGWALASLPGGVGLLVNVPWLISHWFPGEERVPLMVTVSGALLIGVSVLLTRRRGHLRDELSAQADAGTATVGGTGTSAPPVHA